MGPGGTSPWVEGNTGIVAIGGVAIETHRHVWRSGRARAPNNAVRDDWANLSFGRGSTSSQVAGKPQTVAIDGAETGIHLHGWSFGRPGYRERLCAMPALACNGVARTYPQTANRPGRHKSARSGLGRSGRVVSSSVWSRRPHQNRSDASRATSRSEEHTSELQSRPHLVCRLLLEKKKKKRWTTYVTLT